MESDFPKAVQMNSLNGTHFGVCLPPRLHFEGVGAKFPRCGSRQRFEAFDLFYRPLKSRDKCKTCHWNATSLVVKIFMVLFIKMLKTESFQLALLTGNNLIANSFSPKAAGTCLSHGSWWEKPDPSSTIIISDFLILLLHKLSKPNEAVKTTRSDQKQSQGQGIKWKDLPLKISLLTPRTAEMSTSSLQQHRGESLAPMQNSSQRLQQELHSD